MNKRRWQNKRTSKKKWKSYEQTNFHNVAPEDSRNSFYGNNFYQFETFQNFSRPPPTISYPNLMNENPWNLPQQLSQSRVPISHQWRPPPPPLINEPRLPATCTSFFQNKISSTSTIKPPNIKVQHKPENDSRITLEGPLKSPVKPRKTFEKFNIDPPSLKLKPNILSSLKNTRLPQNLDKNKLLQIVNSSTTKFEPAMRELVRQKRLQLSRDLRNKYSSQTSTDQTNDILIPDIDIDLNSLPPQIISKLNNVLEMQNCDKNIPVNLDLKSEYEEFDNDMMLTNNYNNLISSSSDLSPSSFFLLKNEENISESIKLPVKDENNTEHNELKENCGALLISNEKTSDNIDDLFTLSNYGIELPSDVDELQLPSDESSLFNFTEIIKDLSTVDPFSKDINTKRQLEAHDQINIETTNLSPIKKIVDIKDEKNVQTLDENDKKMSCIAKRTLIVNNINDDNNGILGNFRKEDGEPTKEIFEKIIISCNKSNNEHNLTKERKHLSQKNESVFTKETYEKTDNLSDRNKGKSELNSNGIYSEAFKEAVFSHPNIHKEPENENQSAKINSNKNYSSHLQSKEYDLVKINCDKIKEQDVLSQSPKNNGLLWPQINKTTNKDENKEALKMTLNNLDEPENNIDTCMKSKINFFTENLNTQTLVKSVEDIYVQNFNQINKSDTSHKELVLVSSDSDIENINLKKRLSPSDDVRKHFNESCAPKPLKQRLNTFRKHLDAEVKGKVLVVRKKKYKVQSKRRKICDRKSKSNKNINRTSCTLLSKKKTCEVMGFRKTPEKLPKKLSETQKKPKKNFELENKEYNLKVTSCDQKSTSLNENSTCNEISVNYTTDPGKTNHSDLTSETKTTGNTNNLKEIHFKTQQLANTTIFPTDHFLNNKSTEKDSIMENTKTDVSDTCFEFHKNEITEQNTFDKTDEKLKNFKLENSEFIVEKMNDMNHQVETISKQNVEFSKSMIDIKTKENRPNNTDNEHFRSENTIDNKNSVSHVQVDDINKLLSEKDNDKFSNTIDLKKTIKSKISESDSDKIPEILQLHNTAKNFIVNAKYNKNIYDNENVTEHKKKSQNANLLSFGVCHINTDLDYSEIGSDQLCNDSSSKTKNSLTDIIKTKNCNQNIVMNNLSNIKSTNNYHNSDNKNNSPIFQENNTIRITSNEKVDVDLNLKNICPIPVQESKETNINKTKIESQVIVEDELKKNSTNEQELNENCLTITHSDNEQKCKKKIENDQCSNTKKSEKTQIKNKERNQLPEKPEYLKNKCKKHSSHKSNDKLFISASKSKESQVKQSFVSEDIQVSNTPNNDIKIHSSIFENEEILNRLIYIDVEIKKLLDEKFLLYKQLLNRTNSENDNIIKIINNMQISTLTQKDKTSLMNDSVANSEKKQIIKESLAEVNNKTVKNNLNFKYEFSDKGLKRPSSTCSEYSIKTSNKHSYKIHNRASSEDKFIKTTQKKYKDKKYTESDKSQNIKHISSKDKLQFDTLKRKCMSDFELKLNKKKIKLGTDEINKKSEHSKTYYENRKQVKEEKTSHCRKESKKKYDNMDAESIIANSIKQNNKQDKLSVKECKNKNKLYTSNIVPSFSSETVFNKKITENKNINKNYSRKKNMTLNLNTEDFKSISNKIKTESVPFANTTKEKKDNSFDTEDLKHKVAKENKNCDLHLKDLKLNNEHEKGSNSVINSKHDTYQTNDHSNESVGKKNILKGKTSEVYINHAKSSNKLNSTKGKLQDTDFQTEPQIDGKRVKTELDTTLDTQVNKQLDNNRLNERNLKTTLKKCSELNLPRDTLNKIGSNIKNPSRKDKYHIKDCFIKLIPLENLKISEKIMNKHTNNMNENSQININKESVDLSNVNIFMSKNNSNRITTNEITIKSNNKQLPQKDDLSQNIDTNSSNEKHNLFVHLDVSKNNYKATSEIKEAISHTKKIDQIIEEESKNLQKSNSDSFTSQKSTIDSVIESTQNIENLKKVDNIKDEVFVMEIEKIKRISDKEETVDSISHVEEIDLTEENIDLTNGTFDSHVGSILFAKIYQDYLIVACEDGKLYKYNLQNGKLLAKGVGHTSAITCFNLVENQSKDNIDTMIYSSSLDGSFRCFALETMEQISVSLKTDSPIQCMDTCWGFFFLGSNSGHLYRYIIQSEKLADEKREIADKPILVLKATREGSRRVLIVAPRTYPVSIRDAISGLLLRYVTRAPSPTVYSILLSDSLVYCGTSHNLIIGYDFTNGVSSIQYTAGRGIVCLAIHKKMLFAGCYDGQVYIFNLKSQEFIISLPGPGSMILALDIVDDKIIVGCKNSKIGIIEMPEIVKKSFD